MNWIAGLKAGDRVVVNQGPFWGKEIRTVGRVTPKQVIAGSERFWKANGRRVGGSRLSHRIEEWTQGAQDRVDKRRLYEKLRYSVEWDEVPLSKLRRIEEILEEE